jgi:hypothetical protein
MAIGDAGLYVGLMRAETVANERSRPLGVRPFFDFL